MTPINRLNALAGSAAAFAAACHAATPETFLAGLSQDDTRSIRMVQVVGDSMAPEFRPRDWVAVDASDCTPSPPGIFMIWDGMALVIKRLEFINDHGKPVVIITSPNPAYPKRSVPLDECLIAGRVIGKWHRT